MEHKTRGTKYTYNGVTFASIYEANVAYTLDKLGFTWEYEPISLPWLPVVRTRYYTPDFLVKDTEGNEFFLEAKGFFEPSARTKMIAIKKQYPELDIRFSFMQPKNKVGKLTYPEWAEKKGYGLFVEEVQVIEELRKTNKRKSSSNSTRSTDSSSRQTPKSRTQSGSTSGRSARTKTGNVSKDKQEKQRATKKRSSSSISLCS